MATTNKLEVTALDPDVTVAQRRHRVPQATQSYNFPRPIYADLIFEEAAAQSSTPAAGFGYLWVESTAPTRLVFTDDTGADTVLSTGTGDALTSDPLSQFAATTSLQLLGVMSDETGTGALCFATSPTLVTPALGTPASGVLTNCTGTASGLTAGGVVNGSVDVADLANGTDGELITWDAAGAPATVATGTATHVLTSNGAGAAPTFQAAAGAGNLVLGIAAGDETTAITTGTGKAEFQIVDAAFTLSAIYATVTTAPTGSTIIIDVNLNGSTIMTTNKISIDASEKTSDTAATQPGVTTTALTENGVITIDIDQIGSSTAGAGVKVYLVGSWT